MVCSKTEKIKMLKNCFASLAVKKFLEFIKTHKNWTPKFICWYKIEIFRTLRSVLLCNIIFHLLLYWHASIINHNPKYNYLYHHLFALPLKWTWQFFLSKTSKKRNHNWPKLLRKNSYYFYHFIPKINDTLSYGRDLITAK